MINKKIQKMYVHAQICMQVEYFFINKVVFSISVKIFFFKLMKNGIGMEVFDLSDKFDLWFKLHVDALSARLIGPIYLS